MDTHTAFVATFAFPASVPDRAARRLLAGGCLAGGAGFARPLA
ncbi:hypothetical protein N8K70_09395 [Microbacterium betulae]|uniref:Uncharacterized protein n=1 Tax=Microbacterium betulae TaxID=2981139 RepID=A0AA97FGE1_9MICO|nr:hypothetical protein [Microbacterium sp. AB]WOF21609.1 hypothetical protein N8K70_09395 [Microbacterium sp. AB]